MSRVLFLEGAPTIKLKPAATHDSVTEMLNDAFAAEQAAIAPLHRSLQTVLRRRRHVEFPLLPAPVKWHREGDDKFKGHVAWLQKHFTS